MDALTGLALLFSYPDDGYAERAEWCSVEVPTPALDAFARAIATLGTTALQERYIDTFDMNPAATLEIGWHLFGEQYERGQFLVMLRQQLREGGIPETGELPDHLLHVLPLVARMDDTDRAAFVTSHLSPALEKIAGAIAPENPFADLVRAARELIVRADEAPAAAGGCHA